MAAKTAKSDEVKVVEEQQKQNQVPLIYGRITAIMQAVQHLEKDTAVSFNKTNYKAISEQKVTSTIRKELIRNNLVMFPENVRYERNGNIGQVHVTYRMVCSDDGSSITIESVGEGADSQDKASGKAMTYCYKYALLRTFAIPTGEDPDKVSSDELDHKEEVARKQMYKDSINAWKETYPEVVAKRIEWCEKRAKKAFDNFEDNLLRKCLEYVEEDCKKHEKLQQDTAESQTAATTESN
ncbi:TPA: ERF family protein [Bacillus cereus]|uniref:ERF family protein n=1 Tax=Bacillus cereus TaxID=1396 RepID=UPI0032FBE33B|nr:ERF family protein [Bacillus cereus]